MDEPLVKVEELEAPGSQDEEVVQQWRVYARPDGSLAVTVTAILALEQEREVGLKLMVGALSSKTMLIVSEAEEQLLALSQQRT